MYRVNLITIMSLLIINCNYLFCQTQNVGIGTNNPDNSTILHLDVSDDTDYPTKRGLLIPVMAASQRDAIVTPAKGLLVYVTDDNNFYFNSGTSGSPIWTVLLSGLGNVSFANISSDTNITAAMLVGTGASLAPTDLGTITANQFVGTGSTSNAVDLATDETAGILPIVKGGTELDTNPIDGQLLIGNTSTGKYTLATLTEGTGISITNGSGSITIASDATAIDHNLLDNLELAAPGVTWGHIDDQAQTIAGAKTFSSPIISSVADGTSPFNVTSQTLVTNLNADMLDGKHASDFIGVGSDAGGDLNGTYPNPTVVAIQGKEIMAGAPNDGQILRWKASTNQWEYYGPLGIVTSVTVNLPSELIMSGNGLSGDVVIGGTWANQEENLVFASPISDPGGTPSFRTLVDDDIPNNITITNLSGINTGDVSLAGTLDYLTISNQVITRNAIDLTTDVTEILPIANGGTGLGTAPTAGQILIGEGNSGAYVLRTLTAGTGISIANGVGNITITADNTGTVTEVGLDLPAEFAVTGSPVFESGTLTATWTTQSANKVFAGPVSGPDAVPAFRLLDASDISSGILPITKGGTGVASIPNGMLQGNGTNAIAGITAKTNQVTYWSNDNTIAGHDSLSWDPTNRKFSIGGDLEVTGIIDPKALIFIPQASAPTIDEGALYYDAATDKLKIITGSGTETILTGSLGAASGDISGTYPALTVVGLQGISVSTTDPTNGQVLKYNGTEWAPADPSSGSETDPEVSMTTTDAIAKWNGTTLINAIAGTDYLVPNTPITGATHTKITYDADGLVTSGVDLEASDIPNLDAAKITSGTLPVERGGTGISDVAGVTGMLKGNGTSAFTGITNTAGNMTYWSDANTIGGDNDLKWESTNNKLTVTGNVESITSTLTPQTIAPTGTEGSLYYNDTENAVKVFDGTSWNNLGTGNLVVMSAYLNANQNLTNNNWTLINFNSEEFDSHNAYDISTGEFTAPSTGYYQLNSNAKVTMSDGASFYLEIAVYINGTIYSEGNISIGNNGNSRTSSNISNLLKLTLGDKVTIYANAHYTGTPQAIGSASTPYVTYLTIHQVK